MPTSTRNLTLDFMQTSKGQFSSYKLNAILGLKYNHENKHSHNFLVQFQNIKTNYIETVEISPELLRYKFKLGNIYKEGKLISKDVNEYEKYLEIDTDEMKFQEPQYKVLSKGSIKAILGNNNFNAFNYGKNSCYVHEEEDSRYIIPSSVIALYYYFRSSSMKDAIYKGNPFILYDDLNSNLMDRTDAILVLESHASQLDGAFIYRFLTDKTAQKGFIDFFRYISAFKTKRDKENKTTGLIPIKALFPTRETFNIKIRYIEIKDTSTNKKTYLVNEIKNDDSTLDFDKLTVLKKKRKDGKVDPNDENGLHAKRRKPKKRRKNVNIKTPSAIYGTNKIKEMENTQNLSLEGKDISYSSLEEENQGIPVATEKEKKGDVSVSFSEGENSGDETVQQSKLETDKDDKPKASTPPTFDIFLESIKFIEDSNLVSEFIFDALPKKVPTSYTRSNNLTNICSIYYRVKEYVTCSFEYNDINVVLIEVESEHNDFATWVIASKNVISYDDITKLLEMRYSKLQNLDVIKDTYSNLRELKFFTYKHAQINDENDHDEVLERWLLRLFYRLKL